MEDSAIKYFFSVDGSDKRGVQFAKALETGKINELIQVKNFIQTPTVNKLMTTGELKDTDVHPEVTQFLVDTGNFHRALFSTNSRSIGEWLRDTQSTGHFFAQEVVMKFNSLPQSDRDFYDKYVNAIQIDQAGTATRAFPSLGDIQSDGTLDLDTIRLNLRKEGSDFIRFAFVLRDKIKTDTIPVIGSFYGIIPVLGTTMPKSQAQAYEIGYDGNFSVNAADRLGDKTRGFSVNLLELLKNALAKVKDEPEDESGLPASTILDFATGDIIEIKDNQFVKKEGSIKKPIELTKDNCYTTQFKGPFVECSKFIYELILNEDADALDKYFTNFTDSYFAMKSQEEITNIHPDIAVKILKKFGFETDVSSSFGKTIKKFETVSSWMRRLDQIGITQATQNAIKGATKLLTYLDLLVRFVNLNPVILNSGIGSLDRHVEPLVVDPSSYLGRTKIAMIPRISIGEAVQDKHAALIKIASNANMARKLMAIQSSMPFPFTVVRLPGMYGGGNSSTLRPIIRGLIDDLARRGKKLRQSDKDAIESHLDKLEKLDKAIAKLAQQLSEYKDWISIFQNNTSGVISLGTIEQSIESYRKCVEQYSGLEMGILNVAGKLCEESNK